VDAPADVTATIEVPAQRFLLMVRPARPAVDAADWLRRNARFVIDSLIAFGGVLLRGFSVGGAGGFERVCAQVTSHPLRYEAGTTPRRKVGGVYTATDLHPGFLITQHHEMSYLRRWPGKILFYCAHPASEGGETPVCSSRQFQQRLRRGLMNEFARRGVMYIRNYAGAAVWSGKFETDDERVVEERCRRLGLDWEWQGDHLQTRNVAQGVAAHPQTGETLFFNQAHALSQWIRMNKWRPGGLPAFMANPADATDTRFGDGGPVDPAILEEIHAIFEDEKHVFPWQRDDILVLDNMLASHGRMAFRGPREVLAALADPIEPDPS